MPVAPPSMPGFTALWDRLIAVASSDLEARFRAEVDQMRTVSNAQLLPFEEHVSRAVAQARTLGVKVPKRYRDALESATVYIIGERKLVSVAQLAESLVAVRVEQRRLGLATALVDHWYILLDRHLQAVEHLWRACKPLSSAPDYAAKLGDVHDWVTGRQRAIGIARNAVAHPNTIWVRAIDEDGLWEPLLSLGLAVGAGAQMAADQFVGDNASLDHRYGVLRPLTAYALAAEDQSCESLTALI